MIDPQAMPRSALDGARLVLGELREEHRCWIVVEGELDLAATGRFQAAVERALQHGTRLLELDLCEATFIDSSGIHAILSAARRCEQAGCALGIIASRHAGPRRLFTTLGLHSALPFRGADTATG